MLVILSILEITNVPLQVFLLSACTFFSLHPIFYQEKSIDNKNVRADNSLGATSSLVRQLKWWISNNLLHKSVASNQLWKITSSKHTWQLSWQFYYINKNINSLKPCITLSAQSQCCIKKLQVAITTYKLNFWLLCIYTFYISFISAY